MKTRYLYKDQFLTLSFSFKSFFRVRLFIHAFLLFLSLCALSQVNEKKVIKGIKSEKKGEKISFLFYEQGPYYTVFNKDNSSLFLTYSSFEEEIDRVSSINPERKLNNRALLDSLVERWFYPHLKGQKNFDKNFVVTLYSDIEGNIKEIVFTLPIGIDVPIQSFEKLEYGIFSNNLKLLFDSNNIFLKESNSVFLSITYTIKSMHTKFGK